MNKAPILLLLILLATLSFGKVNSYANENKDVNELKLNNPIRIADDSKIFETSGEDKNKTQFKIENNPNDEDSEFMIKGVITAVSSSSITIDGKVINIDSSVTGEIKIVGKLEVGAYAMAKGIVKDSNFYAEKIVVDQRDKKDIEGENEDEDTSATASATPTPTVSPTPTSSSTQSANIEDHDANINFDLSNIILSVQNFLNYLRELAQKI